MKDAAKQPCCCCLYECPSQRIQAAHEQAEVQREHHSQKVLASSQSSLVCMPFTSASQSYTLLRCCSCKEIEEYKMCASLPVLCGPRGNTKHGSIHGGCKERTGSGFTSLESVCTHRTNVKRDNRSKQKTTEL